MRYVFQTIITHHAAKHICLVFVYCFGSVARRKPKICSEPTQAAFSWPLLLLQLYTVEGSQEGLRYGNRGPTRPRPPTIARLMYFGVSTSRNNKFPGRHHGKSRRMNLRHLKIFDNLPEIMGCSYVNTNLIKLMSREIYLPVFLCVSSMLKR